MRIAFKNKEDGIWLEYHEQLPDKMLSLKLKGEAAYKLNLAALYFYGLYRNTVYDSYKTKPDLADDIKFYQKVYQENENSKLSQDNLYQDPLYHYAVAASLNAMQEWRSSNQPIKSYIAYKNNNHHKQPMGFVHFCETIINEKPVVYIAQAGVTDRSSGIGSRLMECVLSHYPPGTEFYILTRVFNKEAKVLYRDRLKFSDITQEEVKQLGYDNRYCGFKHITSKTEVDAIKNKQQEYVEPSNMQNASIAPGISI